MFRKILLLVVVALAAAVAGQALSQGQGTSTPPPPTKGTPTADKSLPPKTSPGSSQPSSNVPPASAAPGRGPASEKASSATKDAAGSKSLPTVTPSSLAPLSSSGGRKVDVERAFVTLNDDNKVPATEAGMITDVKVKEGDSVEKDELVAQIDNRATLAKQEIAKAELNAATAQANNNAEVIVAEKAVEVSKADLESLDEIRTKNRNAISDAEYRKNWFQLQRSLAQVEQATNEKEIAGLTANAKKAQFDAATIELDLRKVKSPFNGQVVEILKKTGDWVTVGEPIMHIVGLDRLKVRGYVFVTGEHGASHAEVLGKPVTITVELPGGKKHTVNGFIGFASPVIEGYGSERQFRVWAEVDNEKAIDPVTGQEIWRIQPGCMASMTIDLTPRPTYPAAKTDGKGKVQSYKPVTGEAQKKGKER